MVYIITLNSQNYKSNIQLDVSNNNITIVFDSVSRMSRNADEGFNLYQELFELGINLIFLKEPHINTETYKHIIKNYLNMQE